MNVSKSNRRRYSIRNSFALGVLEWQIRVSARGSKFYLDLSYNMIPTIIYLFLIN